MTLYLAYIIAQVATAVGQGPDPFDPMPILWLELWLPLVTG